MTTEQVIEEPKSLPMQLTEKFTEEDEIKVFRELEELKLRMDVDGERYKELKEEAGALIAVAGGTSGAYGQIIVTIKDGGATKKFDEHLLVTAKIACPHCHQQHFFPAGMVHDLYVYGTKRGSVEVSIAGKRGGGKKKESGREDTAS